LLVTKFIVKTILVHFFILTGGALLPPLLGLWEVSEAWLWRVAALCFAVRMLKAPIVGETAYGQGLLDCARRCEKRGRLQALRSG
jgi:hypothetical protein